MASIRNLKKDINNTLGSIIDGVYRIEATNGNKISKDGEKIIDHAITVFDGLIAKVNQRSVENKSAHFKGIRQELQQEAQQLLEKLDKLD